MFFDLTEEQLAVQRFVQREIEPIADRIDRDGGLADDLIGKLADVGLLGAVIPHR